MMLTSVYMQQGKYADAVQYAKIVIDSPHKLVQNDDLKMNSAFNKLRSTDDLDEVIYAQEYDNAVNTSDWFPTYAFNSSAVSVFGTYSIFERVYGPVDEFLNVYDKNDLRVQPNQFFHWEYTNPNTGATWSSKNAGCWYYYDEDALLSTGKGTKDWNIFRYAEVLLDGAESIAQSQGVTAEAAGYLAQVQAVPIWKVKQLTRLPPICRSCRNRHLSKPAGPNVCVSSRWNTRFGMIAYVRANSR